MPPDETRDTFPAASPRRWLEVLGPGLVTGASEDDPCEIGTCAQIGAQTGTSLLWLMLLSTPMLQVAQVTCAKLGVVTRKGLSGLLKEHYGTPVAVAAALLTTLANIGTIGADLASVSAAIGLVTHTDWRWFVLPVTLFVWYLQVFHTHTIIRRVLLLLSLALLAYIAAGFAVRPDWGLTLGHTFVPRISFTREFAMAAVGMLGATISPYGFYFQPFEEMAERRTPRDLPDVTLGTTVGMVFSNLISYFVIVATAATLHTRGAEIETAAQAAEALRPIAGPAATYLFAAGIIGAGLLAVPVLATATAGMVGEIAGWRVGLHLRVSRARGFYLTLTLALAFGALIVLSGISPLRAVFYSQIFAGLVSPLLLTLIYRLAARRDILGDHTNSRPQQAWGWFTVAVMLVSLGMAIWSLV